MTRKKDCYLSAQFRRLAVRRGVKRAVMAVAHTMLIIAYTMLKTGRHLPRTRRELSGADQQRSTPAVLRETTTEAWAYGDGGTGGLSEFSKEKKSTHEPKRP